MNKYWHKDCRHQNHKTYPPEGRATGSVIHDFLCLVHKVAFCRCGWEWEYHQGTYSRGLRDSKYDFWENKTTQN